VDTSLWEQAFPQWRHLIARISGPVTWGRYSVLKCDSWSGGRTAILGDSAHAQPPNLGQGGGMAMRNGLALAAFMEDVDDRRDVPDALEAWEHAVRPLTDHCQKWSTLYGEVTHLPDEVRSKVFRGAGDDGWVSSQILRASMTPPLVRRPDIHDNRHLTTTV
jgi:2-polyprenyl-6-methoxyphenol hydroxylase-like FAD-dependent oxidoreductase